MAAQCVAIATGLDLQAPAVSPFFGRLVEGLAGFLQAAGFVVEVFPGRGTDLRSMGHAESVPSAFLQRVDAGAVDGVAAIQLPRRARWYDPLAARNVPVVGTTDDCDVRIGTDLHSLYFLGAGTLLELGARRVALIGWGLPAYLDGWYETVAQLGLETDPTLVHWALAPVSQGIREAAVQLFQGPVVPDGLFLADEVFFGPAAAALRDRGHEFGRTVSLVTHWNECTRPYPERVARLDVHLQRFVRTFGEVLMACLADQPVGPEHRIPYVRRLPPGC